MSYSLTIPQRALLQELERAWKRAPDLRLMQLMENVTGCRGDCQYYTDDDDLKGKLKLYNSDSSDSH